MIERIYHTFGSNPRMVSGVFRILDLGRGNESQRKKIMLISGKVLYQEDEFDVDRK